MFLFRKQNMLALRIQCLCITPFAAFMGCQQTPFCRTKDTAIVSKFSEIGQQTR